MAYHGSAVDLRVQIFIAPDAEQDTAGHVLDQPLLAVEFTRRQGDGLHFIHVYWRVEAEMIKAGVVVDANGVTLLPPPPPPPTPEPTPEPTRESPVWDPTAFLLYMREQIECPFAEVREQGYDEITGISADPTVNGAIMTSGILAHCEEHLTTDSAHVRRCIATILANLYESRLFGPSATEGIITALQSMLTRPADYYEIQGQREAGRALAVLRTAGLLA